MNEKNPMKITGAPKTPEKAESVFSQLIVNNEERKIKFVLSQKAYNALTDAKDKRLLFVEGVEDIETLIDINEVEFYLKIKSDVLPDSVAERIKNKLEGIIENEK